MRDHGTSATFIRRFLVLFFVLTTLGIVSRSFAQMPGADMPVQFRMAGKFYDPEKDKDAGGMYAFKVTVEDRKWIFDVEKADALVGAVQGLTVLEHIVPAMLNFVGPKELLDMLKKPEIAGKSYTLNGYLYAGSKTFRLTDVKNNDAKSVVDPKPSAK